MRNRIAAKAREGKRKPGKRERERERMIRA
jgi:hypothetical protein